MTLQEKSLFFYKDLNQCPVAAAGFERPGFLMFPTTWNKSILEVDIDSDYELNNLERDW